MLLLERSSRGDPVRNHGVRSKPYCWTMWNLYQSDVLLVRAIIKHRDNSICNRIGTGIYVHQVRQRCHSNKFGSSGLLWICNVGNHNNNYHSIWQHNDVTKRRIGNSVLP